MNSDALILALAERLGLIVAGAFLLLTLTPIHKLRLRQQPNWRVRFLQIFFFGAAGILGTYGGNLVSQSVANLRAMAVITGGLFGGPLVGITSGLLAGGHRILIDLGGFSALPCGLATVIEGTLSGLLSLYLKERSTDWRWGALIALVGESLHMGMILLFSEPYASALALVHIIAVPMIILNALGTATFIQVINIVFRNRARQDSIQAQEILDIANATVSHLRQGLTRNSAKATASIIFERVAVGAVAITNQERVLAHCGAGEDHHFAGVPISTDATKQSLHTGQPAFVQNSQGIGCMHPHCPFTTAIVVPLRKSGQVIGTLKLYGTKQKSLDLLLFELGKGLGNLFSTQLELENIQRGEQMLARAEIRRLQAQINPHFLFNSLNTIGAFCRSSPERARELLHDLSSFLRKNLDRGQNFIALSEELDQIRCYLAIEKARFGERIKVRFILDKTVLHWPIPPLILQPLVENSVRHGILPQEEGGEILVQARQTSPGLEIIIQDSGVGMTQAHLQEIIAQETSEAPSGGIGLKNCFQRMEHIFGPGFQPQVRTASGYGTTITILIPMQSTHSNSVLKPT